MPYVKQCTGVCSAEGAEKETEPTQTRTARLSKVASKDYQKPLATYIMALHNVSWGLKSFAPLEESMVLQENMKIAP